MTHFWEYPVTANAADHAARGVGPATDYGLPWGTPVEAPFAGEAQAYWTDEGGWGISITGDDEIFRGQHLAERPTEGHVEWRQVVAKSGNTGSATTGPHLHAYIILKSTGERVSFQKWYEDILPNESGTPTTVPPVAGNGTQFTPPDEDAYWYTSRDDANNLRNVHGNGGNGGRKFTDEPMLEGTYEVVNDPGDSFAVRAHDGSIVWVSGRLRNGLH